MHQNSFIPNENAINTDETAHKVEVLPGSIVFTIWSSKLHEQMREQTTFVMNGGLRIIARWYRTNSLYRL